MDKIAFIPMIYVEVLSIPSLLDTDCNFLESLLRNFVHVGGFIEITLLSKKEGIFFYYHGSILDIVSGLHVERRFFSIPSLRRSED